MNIFGKISVLPLVVLLFAACGGQQGSGSGTGAEGPHVPMLFHCIPSDAIAFASCEKASDALSYYDSSSVLSRLPLGEFAGCPAVLALCCNTAVDPVLVIDAGPAGADSTAAAASLFAGADSLSLLHGSCVLECASDRGRDHSVLFFCRTENVLSSVKRHIDTGVSILDAHLFDLAFEPAAKADNAIFFRHEYASRLIPRSFLSGFIPRERLVPFLKKLSGWMVLIPSSKKRNAEAELFECGDITRLTFNNTLALLPPSASKLSGILPPDAEFVIDLPISSAEDFRKAFESCKDADVTIDSYRDTIARYSKLCGISPLVWEKRIGVSEVALVCRQGSKVVLYRSSDKPSAGIWENPRRGFIPNLYGRAFNLSDSDRVLDGGAFCASIGEWTVCGCERDVISFTEAADTLSKEVRASLWPVQRANAVVWTPDWYLVCNEGRNKLTFTR